MSRPEGSRVRQHLWTQSNKGWRRKWTCRACGAYLWSDEFAEIGISEDESDTALDLAYFMGGENRDKGGCQ